MKGTFIEYETIWEFKNLWIIAINEEEFQTKDVEQILGKSIEKQPNQPTNKNKKQKLSLQLYNHYNQKLETT